jgi:hypothetical protein
MAPQFCALRPEPTPRVPIAMLLPQDSEDQYLKVRDENLQLKKMLHQSART